MAEEALDGERPHPAKIQSRTEAPVIDKLVAKEAWLRLVLGGLVFVFSVIGTRRHGASIKRLTGEHVFV
jgi:hypothetical protein